MKVGRHGQIWICYRNRINKDTATLENSLAVSYKVCLSYDPAITLIGIYPRKMKAYIHTNTCT